MRRKSERNKAKGSPEKKVEKPTRKSTRRRAGRKSPSTSPEKEVVTQKAETIVHTEENIKEEETESQSCSQDTLEKDVEKVEEEKVSSSEKEKNEQAKEEDEEDGGSVWKVARADASPGEIQKLKLCRQRNTSETSSDSRKKDSNSKWQECGEGVAGEVDSADEQLVSCRRMPSGEEPNDPSSSSNPGQESKQEEVSDSKDLLPETTSANLLSDDKPNIDRQGDACQADDKHDIEHGKAAANDNALSPTTAASSNGELERKDSQETDENRDKHDERTEEPETREFRKESSVENEAEQPKSTTDDDDDNDEDKKKKVTRKSDSSSDEERSKPKVGSTVKTPPRTARRKHRNKYGDSSNSDTAESEEESPSTATKVEESDVQEETKSVEDRQDDVKERSTSPEIRTKLVEEEEEEIGAAGTEKAKSSEISSNKVEDVSNTASTQSAQKPAKVNLKRSFAARISAEKHEVKKEEASGTSNDDTTSQNKENRADSDQERCIPRKRRWGTTLSTDSAPAFSISTDSLKVLVPGAKPLPINEVRLSKDEDEDREDSRNQEKRRDSSDSAGENKMKDETSAQKNGTMKKDKMDNHIGARRKVSIVKETPHMKSPSPPASKPTNILLIKNLVRPFTLNQIKELLSRTGTIVENGFWMDRIKSKCFVEYANEDQAFETRQALHGISWPLSNPKRLQVEYATKEDMEQARETSKDQPVARKTETVTTDPWQQEWGREEKTNAKVTVVREWDLGKEDGQPLLKDKEREKKDHDKKKRQRSRSPGLEAHLPAPARKFKKKEDEPPPAKLLDDLFRKTKATPCIYWLPLTNEQIVVKEEMRRQHMAEHARRLEEMRRAERNRDGRRRRSPRK